MKSVSRWTLAVVVAGLALLPLTAMADSITLSSGTGGGAVATGPWAGGGFWITSSAVWEGSAYRYTYTIYGDANGGALSKNLSHFIFEVSPNFTLDDIWDVSGGTWLLDTWGPPPANGSSNEGMPSALYGIKVTPPDTDKSSLTFSFLSDRVPVLGDFYAKDGSYTVDPTVRPPVKAPVLAYNAQFGVTPIDLKDWEPGKGYDWIIVPDSKVVPEPATLGMLLLGGIPVLGRAIRRKS